MGILNHCCCCGCSYNLNNQNRNINSSSLQNVSYRNLRLKLVRITSSQTLSRASGSDILNRNNQIAIAFQLCKIQLITGRDGICTCINGFILSITENTGCKIRQHGKMETSAYGRNTGIYSSTAKGTSARDLANID